MQVEYQEIHREIIELSRAGNSKAQYQLYKLYSRAMFNICMRMMNNREEAEDVLQEGFTEAFMKLDSFRFESAFGAWLKRIMINRCINALKKKKLDLVSTEDNPAPDILNDEVDYTGIEMEVKRVHAAIEQLPEGYRVILSLYLLEGYDHSEISQILNITESTSKSQLSRAKLKLKSILKNEAS